MSYARCTVSHCCMGHYVGEFLNPVNPLKVHFATLPYHCYDNISVDIVNKLISMFSVNYDAAFVSYAKFTASYCCIGHYVGISICQHPVLQIQQYNFFQKINLQEYFLHKHYIPAGFYWYKTISTFLDKNVWMSGWDCWSQNAHKYNKSSVCKHDELSNCVVYNLFKCITKNMTESLLFVIITFNFYTNSAVCKSQDVLNNLRVSSN